MLARMLPRFAAIMSMDVNMFLSGLHSCGEP
jgi:hypothetical protein